MTIDELKKMKFEDLLENDALNICAIGHMLAVTRGLSCANCYFKGGTHCDKALKDLFIEIEIGDIFKEADGEICIVLGINSKEVTVLRSDGQFRCYAESTLKHMKKIDSFPAPINLIKTKLNIFAAMKEI